MTRPHFAALLRALLFGSSPLVMLVLWQIVSDTHVFPSQIFVSPKQVFLTFVDLWNGGDISTSLQASGQRLALGYGCGSLLGILFGLGSGLSRTIAAYSGVLFHCLRQVPTIALVPLFILLFGIDETFKVALISFAAFFPAALGTIDGIQNVPASYRDVGRVLRFSRPSIVRRIFLPAALPSIVTGLRLGLSRSWLILVAAEILASNVGIGHLINWGRQLFQIDVVMVGVIMAGIIGSVLDVLLRTLESRLSNWKVRTT